MVNPESSHVSLGWISVISVDFSVISIDFIWFQLILGDFSVIPDFPSVESHCSECDSSFPLCEITHMSDSSFPLCEITHMCDSSFPFYEITL